MLYSRLAFGQTKNNKSAFTIVEIMLVIALIVLVAVFLLPNILRLQTSRNEERVKAALKSLAFDLETYRQTNILKTYPEDLNQLARKEYTLFADEKIIPGTLSFEESGYWFIYLPQAKDASETVQGYDVFAMPVQENSTGVRTFVMNEGGTVYIDNGKYPAAVDEQDSPIL